MQKFKFIKICIYKFVYTSLKVTLRLRLGVMSEREDMGKQLLRAMKCLFDDDELQIEPHSFSKKHEEIKLKQKVKVRKLNQSFYIVIPKGWIQRLGKVLAMELEFKPNPRNPFASEIIVKPVKERSGEN